jgi:pimeloyl-ACP methyl ester carboxylesterase
MYQDRFWIGAMRTVVGTGLIEAGAPLLAICAMILAGSAGPASGQAVTNPIVPVPVPAQVPVKEGLAPLADTRLWYWDTGGEGTPVVLLHPASGSGLIWSYQQPALAKAGHRVIAYSRRSYYNSDPVIKGRPGIGSADLQNLIEFLGLTKFHLVGSAAGGSIAVDYALSHPERLLSLTIADNSAGVRDGEIVNASNSIRAKGFDDMAVEFRELGPSYRAANPEGAKLWTELAHKAVTGGDFRQMTANEITTAKIEGMKVPTLLITGDADLITPPSIMRLVARHIPGSEIVIAPESGHSTYWEQPDLFNRSLSGFFAKHAK